jgi:hypothetical protein
MPCGSGRNALVSYIKVFNLSTKLMVNHIYGRMSKELVPALMAWHIGTRPVFLCRPGQTLSGIQTDGEDYVAQRTIDPSDPRFLDMSAGTKRKNFRGDTLGPSGVLFRQELLEFCSLEVQEFMLRRSSVRDMADTGTSISGLMKTHHQHQHHALSQTHDDEVHCRHELFPMRILTSTMPRAADTVRWDDYDFPVSQMSNLNPLDKGDFAGLELPDIKKDNPDWYAELERDPFGTR